MKRLTWIIAGTLVVAVVAAGVWHQRAHRRLTRLVARPSTLPILDGGPAVRRGATSRLSAAEKSARVDKIRHDYDEIRTRAAADYLAAGTAFPGGLSAFLRQLALLERERRKDLLTVLTPAELEALELRESHAGAVVQRLLGSTTASEAQRRAVFRLQQEFDDQFGLTFDLTPAFLLVRERQRQAMQEQIHAILGDALFASWLVDEGPAYASFTAFASAHGLAATVPLALWRLRNQYVIDRLAISALPGLGPEQVRAQQSALARRAEIDARALLGSAAIDPSVDQVLSWIPRD
ncbi:MAG TPA: hypothetical protein VHE61_08895 [Opitutaceae bacterium]|nr:hypothetical protein [Opitutaceae bacterium]